MEVKKEIKMENWEEKKNVKGMISKIMMIEKEK